jgi:hypothetical protein
MGARPTIHAIVWFLNTTNTVCAFPSKHLAILSFGSSSRSPWIWIVAFSPAHLWCASLYLIARQQICKSRIEHTEKSSAEQHRREVDSWWSSDSGSTVICFIPAAILNAITSAAMLLFEREFEKPWSHVWTPLLQVGMECFTVVMFVGCRYADCMLWREDRQSLRPFRGYEVVIGLMGVLTLFVVRSVCETLIPASAFDPSV